ncbi:MAG: MBL fold metallo-hydrolase [Halobacteria archaeon]
MELTFLGTGSAIPSERMQSGLLLHDHPLLIDCGSGVLHNLNRTDVKPDEVGEVLVTHNHLDHVNDVMALAKANWLLGRDSLDVYGPGGTRDTIDSLLEAYEYLEEKIDITVHEVTPGESIDIKGTEIDTLETSHSVESMAVRYGNHFVYSGDTEPLSEVVEFAQDCSVLIHECSFPDDVEVSNHTRPSELGRILQDSEIPYLYLTHLYPHTRNRESGMIRKIKENYDGQVKIAKDMKKLSA